MDSCKSVKIHPPFSKICPFLIHTGLGLLHFSFPCFVSLLVAPVPGLFCCLVGDVYPGVCLSIYLSIFLILSCPAVLSYPILSIYISLWLATMPQNQPNLSLGPNMWPIDYQYIGILPATHIKVSRKKGNNLWVVKPWGYRYMASHTPAPTA